MRTVHKYAQRCYGVCRGPKVGRRKRFKTVKCQRFAIKKGLCNRCYTRVQLGGSAYELNYPWDRQKARKKGGDIQNGKKPEQQVPEHE